jgi:hypothetical protein
MTEEIDLEAANERLAHMGLMPAAAEGQPLEHRDLTPGAHGQQNSAQIEQNQQNTPARSSNDGQPIGRAPRSDKGKPRAPKPKPPEPEPVPASATVQDRLWLKLYLTVDEARELSIDMADRHADIATNFQDQIIQHLADRIASLTTPAA